jgi:hypothetical protein
MGGSLSAELLKDIETHLIPVSDNFEHDLSSQCRCNPIESEENPGCFIHTSFDGREDFLFGRRKYS